MSMPVTVVRSEDLLDESRPQRLARTFGLTRRRQISGLVFALITLPVMTLALDMTRDKLALDGQVLLYLLVVVATALIGGIVVAVASAVASALLINYFFVDPVHTLSVADPDQVVALIVFVVVAAIVSGAVELAARRARAAERARAEAETMSALAGPSLDGQESLREVLRHARESFDMESIALLARQRGSGEWLEAEHVGWAPAEETAPLRFDIPIGPNLRMTGRGPALFAEDQRVLHAFAAAARTAFEGGQLTGEAREARTLATADRQRTALLSAVGHDLRTPLAAIKAAVSTLRQTDVEWSAEERRELLATIEDSTDRLDGIVRNLLDASRLQAGALSVQPEAVALDEVVSAALLDIPQAAPRISVEVPEDLAMVHADRGLLQRVLVNVLENAVRHGGDEQPVEVVASAGSGSARLEIIDHGLGITGEEEDVIFEPFRRLDDRGEAGVGLGLSVAHGFVEAMEGAMVADATPGGGLTIRIRLRLHQAPEGDSAGPE